MLSVGRKAWKREEGKPGFDLKVSLQVSTEIEDVLKHGASMDCRPVRRGVSKEV
jgi:hypothetical protein